MKVRFDNPWGQDLLFDHVHRLLWQFDGANNDMPPPTDEIEYKDTAISVSTCQVTTAPLIQRTIIK
jgi:hypothetical protein